MNRDRAVALLTGIIGHREQCEEIVDAIIEAATESLHTEALMAGLATRNEVLSGEPSNLSTVPLAAAQPGEPTEVGQGQ